MTPDSFADALQHLDPGSRALLDLSLRRGLGDAEIAELLGADSEYVSSSREAAIGQLADDLGMHGDPDAIREALEDMPEDAWRPRADGPAASANGDAAPAAPELELELEPEHRQPAGRQPPALPRAPRSRRSRLALAAVLLAGVILATVLALSGGEGGSKSSSTPGGKAVSSGTAGKPAPLSSLGARGMGTATLDGRALTLAVSGLSQPVRGSYELWLYNDQIDARPVASFRSGTAKLTAELPARAASYRFLDISLEPADGNPNHSGQSVMRVPLRALR